MDSAKRTLLKATLWNVLGFYVMSLVGYLATGSWSIGGAMALINTAVGFAMYFAYERVWSVITWGRHAE
ncbi:DUF2061 domain-containing protein [Lentibacter algarum]|uniref:DUF2061 domain-containing protein n=1 Tax=Lentibacter algarum TaxID=576131 RepID=UPI001C083185|nr:DUF2061 domain-containing protein [Lentibacter algarum]MBU2982927.1 DUF2061 domain-containing protein [Lentibacter algarum]